MLTARMSKSPNLYGRVSSPLLFPDRVFCTSTTNNSEGGCFSCPRRLADAVLGASFSSLEV